MSNSDFWQYPQTFLQFLRQLLIAHWGALLLLLVGVAFPLLVFEQLAIVIWRDAGGFSWDESILMAIHATAQPQLDRLATIVTKFGGFRGVFPIGSLILLALLYWRRWRSLTYLLTTFLGSILINRTAKELLHRVRPHFWDSLTPELDFAFPSGHAMTSMTFIAALVIVTWGTRWGWLLLAIGSLYVPAIGWTRLYLGVHFPSDVLAGWMVALAWAIGVSFVIKPHLTGLNNLEQQAPPEETALLPEEVQAVSNKPPA